MNLVKDALFDGLSVLGLPRERAVILMYHSVSERTDYFMNVLPSRFAEQMAYVAKSGRAVVALNELVRRLKSGEPLGGAIAITFDDGYRDNYTVAYPILRKYGFPATIFVTTDSIGTTDKSGLPRLSESEIVEMARSGLVDVQPHSMTHPKLGELAEGAVRAEVAGSKARIESLLGKTCAHFAYPYGSRSDVAERVVRECGFQSATTVGEGTVGPDTDALRLPRVSIDSSTSMAQFRGKLTRAVDIYQSLKSRP